MTGAAVTTLTADDTGRLRIPVDLGPSHTQEQFSLGARPAQDLPGYFNERTVTITRVAGPLPPRTDVAEPRRADVSGSGGRLPATGERRTC